MEMQILKKDGLIYENNAKDWKEGNNIGCQASKNRVEFQTKQEFYVTPSWSQDKPLISRLQRKFNECDPLKGLRE